MYEQVKVGNDLRQRSPISSYFRLIAGHKHTNMSFADSYHRTLHTIFGDNAKKNTTEYQASNKAMKRLLAKNVPITDL